MGGKQKEVYQTGLRAIFGIEHIPRKILIMIVLGLSLIAMLVVWQTSTIFPNQIKAEAEAHSRITPTIANYNAMSIQSVTALPITPIPPAFTASGMLELNPAPDNFVMPTVKPGTCISDPRTC